MVRNTRSMLLIGLLLVAAATGLIAIPASSTMAATAMQQKTFATPAAAVEALIAANRANKMRELLALLGPKGAKLIHSGDPVADKRGRDRFVAAYEEAHKLELDGQDKAILIVGKEEWPLPIPLVRQQAGWRFDTKAGVEEILNRRIGHNELSVIEVCRAYVVAQREYAAKHLRPGRLPRICAALHEHRRTAQWALLAGQTRRRREPFRPAYCPRPGGRL